MDIMLAEGLSTDDAHRLTTWFCVVLTADQLIFNTCLSQLTAWFYVAYTAGQLF
jgi:hypothetical protein